MARVLIATYPDDVHAYEVSLALADRGHVPQLWHGADFPTLQTAGLRFESEPSWTVRGPGLELGERPSDTVWHRRPTPAALPEDLHPSDVAVAQRECNDFVDGLWHFVAPDAFWVNPLGSRARASSKAVQLWEAQRAGWRIPPTLMSNDPEQIRAFVGGGPCIYKAFYPAQWEHGEDVAVLLTSEIEPSDLPDDDVLRLTPGIFQRRVPKAHELRVNVMGATVLAARLNSQEAAATQLDWRASAALLGIEPTVLPPAAVRQCQDLLRRLGLVFGCLDFIVTPGGELVFLEVNPMGQFLWLEEACPDIPLLDAFCSFLAAGRQDFVYDPPPDRLRHHDYYDRAVTVLEQEKPRHVEKVETFVSRDDPEAFDEEPLDRRDTTPPV